LLEHIYLQLYVLLLWRNLWQNTYEIYVTCKLCYVLPGAYYYTTEWTSHLVANCIRMWSDLTKAGFHTHNGKADFTITQFIHQWTNNPCVMFPWSAFPGACFLSLSDMLECSGDLQMAVVWLDKHLPSWKLLHD